MNKLTAISVFALCAMGAAAQDVPILRKMGFAPIGVMGKVVKGAPYSADEITESLQVLADGTRISHQSQVTVYRDGEGRVRRESPTGITIWDPVAGVTYSLDPKTMTGIKSHMGTVAAAGQKVFYFSSNGEPAPDLAAGKAEAEAQAMAAALDKLKAELAASQSAMVVNGNPANGPAVVRLKEQLDQAMVKVSQTGAASPAKTEFLASKPSKD